MSLGLPGAEPEHFTLLRRAGVDRFEKLRAANPQTLHQALADLNARAGLVSEVPEQDTIVEWIDQARRLRGELPRVEDTPDLGEVVPTSGEELRGDERIFRDSPGD